MQVSTEVNGSLTVNTHYAETSILIDALKLYADEYYNKHHTSLEEGFNALPSYNEKHYECAYKMWEDAIGEYTKDVILTPGI